MTLNSLILTIFHLFKKEQTKKILKKTNLKNKFRFSEFILNSSINSSTMIISRKIIDNLKFKNVKRLEDYLFKCQILKKGFIAYKVNNNLAYYRILNNSRSSNKIRNIVYLWKINKKYNQLNFLKIFFFNFYDCYKLYKKVRL